jgi:hypothetical protein
LARHAVVRKQSLAVRRASLAIAQQNANDEGPTTNDGF